MLLAPVQAAVDQIPELAGNLMASARIVSRPFLASRAAQGDE